MDFETPPILTTKQISTSNIYSESNLTLFSNHKLFFNTPNLLIRYNHIDNHIKNVVFGSNSPFGHPLQEPHTKYEKSNVPMQHKFEINNLGSLELFGIDALEVSSSNTFVERDSNILIEDGTEMIENEEGIMEEHVVYRTEIVKKKYENYVNLCASNELQLSVPGTSNFFYGNTILSDYIYGVINNPKTSNIDTLIINHETVCNNIYTNRFDVRDMGEYLTGSIKASNISTSNIYTDYIHIETTLNNVLDDQGNPLLDENGNNITEQVITEHRLEHEPPLIFSSSSAVNLDSLNIVLNNTIDLDDYIKQFLDESGLFGIKITTTSGGTKIDFVYDHQEPFTNTNLYGFCNSKYNSNFIYDINYSIHLYDALLQQYEHLSVIESNSNLSSNVQQTLSIPLDVYSFSNLEPGNKYEIRAIIQNQHTNTNVDYGVVKTDIFTIPPIEFMDLNIPNDSSFSTRWTYHHFDVQQLEEGYRFIDFKVYVKCDSNHDGVFETGDGSVVVDLGYTQTFDPGDSNIYTNLNYTNIDLSSFSSYYNDNFFKYCDHKFVIVSTNTLFTMEREFIFTSNQFPFSRPDDVYSIGTSYDFNTGTIEFNIGGLTNNQWGGTSEIEYVYTSNDWETDTTHIVNISGLGITVNIQEYPLVPDKDYKIQIRTRNRYENQAYSPSNEPIFKIWKYIAPIGDLIGPLNINSISSDNTYIQLSFGNSIDNNIASSTSSSTINVSDIGYDYTLNLKLSYGIGTGTADYVYYDNFAYNLTSLLFTESPYINFANYQTITYSFFINVQSHNSIFQTISGNYTFERPSTFNIQSVNVIDDTLLELSWSTSIGTGNIRYVVTNDTLAINSGYINNNSYQHTVDYLPSIINNIKVTAYGTGSTEISYGTLNVGSFFSSPSDPSNIQLIESGTSLINVSWYGSLIKSTNGKTMYSDLTYYVFLRRDSDNATIGQTQTNNTSLTFANGGINGYYTLSIYAQNIYGHISQTIVKTVLLTWIIEPQPPILNNLTIVSTSILSIDWTITSDSGTATNITYYVNDTTSPLSTSPIEFTGPFSSQIIRIRMDYFNGGVQKIPSLYSNEITIPSPGITISSFTLNDINSYSVTNYLVSTYLGSINVYFRLNSDITTQTNSTNPSGNISKSGFVINYNTLYTLYYQIQTNYYNSGWIASGFSGEITALPPSVTISSFDLSTLTKYTVVFIATYTGTLSIQFRLNDLTNTISTISNTSPVTYDNIPSGTLQNDTNYTLYYNINDSTGQSSGWIATTEIDNVPSVQLSRGQFAIKLDSSVGNSGYTESDVRFVSYGQKHNGDSYDVYNLNNLNQSQGDSMYRIDFSKSINIYVIGTTIDETYSLEDVAYELHETFSSYYNEIHTGGTIFVFINRLEFSPHTTYSGSRVIVYPD